MSARATTDLVWHSSLAYSQGEFGQGPNQTFVSRPDLHAPAINILSYQPGRTAGGYYLIDYMGNSLAMPGPVIMDQDGGIIYASPTRRFTGVTDISVFNGQSVFVAYNLTGRYIGGMEHGYYQIYNTSYQEIDRVTYKQTGSQMPFADIHEFGVIPRDNQYILASYGHPVKADISAAGGHPDSWVWDSGFQIQSADHEVVFNTTALKMGLQVGDNMYPHQRGRQYIRGGPFDAFHINSVQKDDDGSYLVGFRGTSAVYKVEGTTGKTLWQLGGRRSDFEIDSDARFAYQHHPRWLNDSSVNPRYLSLFDNAATEKTNSTTWRTSRGLVLRVDMSTMKVEKALELPHPRGRSATAEGSVQQLSNGNFLVGFGAIPEFAEYSPTGEVVFDAAFGSDDVKDHNVKSYRTVKKEWHATPAAPPDVGFAQESIYASWNGATEHAYWAFAEGDDMTRLQVPLLIPKTGFESHAPLFTDHDYVAAVAIDQHYRCLGVSRIYHTSNTSATDTLGICDDIRGLPRQRTGKFDMFAFDKSTLIEHAKDDRFLFGVMGLSVLLFVLYFARRGQAGYTRVSRKVPW